MSEGFFANLVANAKTAADYERIALACGQGWGFSDNGILFRVPKDPKAAIYWGKKALGLGRLSTAKELSHEYYRMGNRREGAYYHFQAVSLHFKESWRDYLDDHVARFYQYGEPETDKARLEELFEFGRCGFLDPVGRQYMNDRGQFLAATLVYDTTCTRARAAALCWVHFNVLGNKDVTRMIGRLVWEARAFPWVWGVE